MKDHAPFRLLFLLALSLVPSRLSAQDGDLSALALRVEADRLRAHVAFLADDRLAGRLGGSEGEAEAARYIAARFEEYGLRPAFEGEWFQEFPLAEVAVVRRGTLRAGERGLRLFEDFTPVLASAGGSVEARTVAAAEGADLQGRVALVRLDGDGADPAALALAAQDKGALAVVLLHERKALLGARGVLSPEDYRSLDLASHGISLFRDHLVRVLGTFKLGALDPRAVILAQLEFLSETTQGDSGELLIPGGSWTARRRVSIPVVAVPAGAIEEGVSIRLDLEIERHRIVSRNVAGVLPATVDPETAGALVVGAHFDHLGATEPPTGILASVATRTDYVWNGADDNASGTASILEIARVLAGSHRPRRRAVVFVAFGSEEYGLVGSGHYVRSPAVPLDRTVGMLNLDMVGRNPGSPILVAGVASGKSLAAILEEARRAAPLETKDDDRYVLRSDQASFLTRRVPALFFSTGEHPDYHEASDELETLSIERVEAVTRLGVALAAAWRDAEAAPAFEGPYLEKVK